MEEWKNPREEQKQKGWILPSAILITGLVLAGMAGCMIAQPTFRDSAPSAVSVNPGRLREHVVMLSKTLYPRDYTHLENLDRCADYILNAFTGAGAEPDIQPFEVNSKTYRNIIGRFAVGKGSKIIIGAHYDAFGSSQGADDNASGVAGLIELAHLFGKYTPNQEIELVAYSLEEPPFFRSQRMGSAFHAKQIAESGQKISGVIVLEMIGFFSDERGSQSYPSILLHLFYPKRGNFIGVVGRLDQGDWIKQIKIGMKGTTDLPVYSIRAPADIPGIDFSDHRNYWPYDINALMISDTAFYRNRAYHTEHDTADRLDYEKMSKVVTAVFEAVQALP